MLSPGPCTPNEAGICLDLVREASGSTPILGVCLGHQAIGQAFGGEVVRAPVPMHGKISRITHNARGLFRGLNGPFQATRYHSLTIARDSAPEALEVSAESDDGLIMAVAHRELPVYGVQFHPESIASEHGHALLRNFLDLARAFGAARAILKEERAPGMELFKPLIAKVAAGAQLTRAEAADAFDAILSGEVTPAQMGGFLMALRVRGETVEEITGAVSAMRAKMLRVAAPADAIDVVGTGGDGSGSYNVSTLAAIIVAACGVPVAKHGNRAASSKSGAADALAALGVKVGVAPELRRALHPRSGHRLHDGADPSRGDAPRRPDARRTRHAHDLQPARAAVQSGRRQAAIDRRLFRAPGSTPMAEVLRNLGSERVWITHGADGLDEMIDDRRRPRSSN